MGRNRGGQSSQAEDRVRIIHDELNEWPAQRMRMNECIVLVEYWFRKAEGLLGDLYHLNSTDKMISVLHERKK